jgi:hypothetical protein
MPKTAKEIVFPKLLWDDVYVTTEEFMSACGINSKSEVSRYVRMGIINPTKSGKKYMFCGSDQSSLLSYKESKITSPNKQQSLESRLDKLTVMVESILSMLSNGNFASQSYTTPTHTTANPTQKFETPNPELQTQQPNVTKTAVPLTSKKSSNNLTLIHQDEPLEYTVYGQTKAAQELLESSNHVHVPLTLSKGRLERLYTRNGQRLITPDQVNASLAEFSKTFLGIPFDGIITNIEHARREPDEPMFDEYYSIVPDTYSVHAAGRLSKREEVYSYNQALKKLGSHLTTIKQLKNLQVPLDYPQDDFETCLVMVYHELNAKFLKHRADNPTSMPQDIIPGYINSQKAKTIFDIVPLYHEYAELIHEPRYFKPTKPKHGDNKPLAVDNNNTQRFPDSWEANRYITTNGKYTFPDNAIAEMRAATRKMLDLQSTNMTHEGDVLYKEAHDYHGKLARERMAFTTYYGIDTDTGEE